MTLAKQFLKGLKNSSNSEIESFASEFLKKHSITGYTCCYSDRKCGWVCVNAIFTDGSVYGRSCVSPVSLMVRGFSENSNECYEYSTNLATEFHN